MKDLKNKLTEEDGGIIKILPIDKCNQCFYCQWDNELKSYQCIKTKSFINRMSRINGNCPLEDYKELI
jgi:hypothetical protein